MSVPPSSSLSRRPPRRRSRSPLLRPVLAIVAIAVTFLVGLALGRALEEGPSPGGTQTNVRTLQPRSLPPATRTVTVTETTDG